MRTVLLTGFAPFGGGSVNPSALAVEALAAETPAGAIAGLRLQTAILPVTYARAGAALHDAMHVARPDIVIAVGLAAGRADIAVERVAVNLDDATLPDNDGVVRIDTPVVPGGPVAYLADLPVKAIAARIRSAGIPASVSHSAGSFLCNHIFYLLCHEAAQSGRRPRVGFIHVPALPEQAVGRLELPSMSLPTIVTALRSAIIASADTESDLHVAEGPTY